MPEKYKYLADYEREKLGGKLGLILGLLFGGIAITFVGLLLAVDSGNLLYLHPAFLFLSAGGIFLILIGAILTKNKVLIWPLSFFGVGGLVIIFGWIFTGDENCMYRNPIATVLVICAVIWFLAGFPLGFLGWGPGRGGAGVEKEEEIKHYKPGLIDYKYIGKSIRRGNTIKHYDASGRYRGKSEVKKK